MSERSYANAVKKWQLLELIRRVHELTNINKPVIVGSQSLFAITDQVPPIVARSVEADFLIAQHGIEARQKVGDELGVTSGFYEAHGYYADHLDWRLSSWFPVGKSVCNHSPTKQEPSSRVAWSYTMSQSAN